MRPISLASGVLPEFGPIETINAAAAAGFDAVGLWIEPETWNEARTRQCRAALAYSGLPLLDVEVVWIKPDSDLDMHRRSIDIGAELGARNILCVSSDPDMGATAAKLAALCEHAEPAAMRVALEFGIFTEVKSLAAALAILNRVAHPMRALLVDPIHVDRSGAKPSDLAAIPTGLLPYAQFCDAPAERPDPTDFDAIIIDAIDLRCQCGEGGLPISEMLAALPGGIPLSIELRSKALRDGWPEPVDRAKVTADITRKWLATHAA